MKIVRFRDNGRARYGVVEGSWVVECEGSPFAKAFKKTRRKKPLKSVRLLAPAVPSKIAAVGLNYRDHAQEGGLAIPAEMIIFLKPSTSVINPGGEIIYPDVCKRVDYEAELGIVIGKKCHNVSPERAKEYILGYTCFNDVTARDLQRKDGQWTRGKSFNTFAPLGPWIVTDLDPSALKIEAYLNGQVKQSSNTKNFVWGVEQMVSFISKVMTLLPGDVIATGTPSGIGPMQPGDEIEIRIEGIGSLKNRVVKPS